MKKSNFLHIFNSIESSGGCSYSFNTGVINPENGYMISLPGLERTYPIPQSYKQFQNIVRDYLRSTVTPNKDAENKLYHEDGYLGFWCHDGLLYINVSENVQDIEQAAKLATMRHQIAFYDCQARVNLPLQAA
jgi:hypothetical protein